MTFPFAAADVLRYLALALVWTFAGRAILSAAGQRALGTTGWLLAPAVAQAFLAVILGMSAVLLVPIRMVSVLVWIAVLALATAGLAVELIATVKRDVGARSDSAGPLLVLGVAAIVPAVVLLPYFVHGFGAYAGTTHPDAWSYTVFGAYLSEYPRLTHGGLSPVYQWAYVLSGTRFVASASLGWLTSATHEGDTQAAFGLLLALSTFVIGSTCAATGRVLGLPNRLLLLAAVAGGGGNWIANAILASNLDNLLALSYLPALAVLGLDAATTVPQGRAVLVGLLIAGATYTYPEFGLIGVSCGSLYFVHFLFKWPIRLSVISLILCIGTTSVLVWPYVGELWQFLRMQATSGVSVADRPAAFYLRGLVDPLGRIDALWALGAEDTVKPSLLLARAAAVLLSWLAIFGVIRLVRNRALASLATLALVAVGFSLFVWQFDYGYGAYKFILLGWWLVVIAVLLGVHECSKVHPLFGAVAVLVASATFWVSALRSVTEAMSSPQPNIAAFRELGAVDRLAHDAPIAISVADNTAAHWATYFLRHEKTRLVSYSGYLAAPHVQPALQEAESIPWDSLRLLLTDATDGGPVVEQQSWKRVWGNSSYTLWDTGDAGWAVVWKIDNGYPFAAGPNIVWVGDKPVTIVATASKAGVATVHADLGLSQPIAPSLGPIRLLTANGEDAKCEWTFANRGSSLLLGLQAGNNVLTLAKTSPVAVPVLPEADQRHPFMVGLVKPTLEFSPGVTAVHCP